MLMAVLALSSCKKNGNNEPEKVSGNCKIVSIKEDNEPATTYSYNADGKVSKVTNLYGFGTGEFTYQTDKVNFTDVKGTDNQSFNIDASGRIISDEFDIYKYNSEGYLIEKAYKSTSMPEFVLSYDNGNLVKVVEDGEVTTDITYYKDEASQNLLGYENAIYSIFNSHTYSSLTATFTGKTSKNLVKTITVQGIIQGQIKETYVYKKDQDGKIISLVITREAPAGYGAGVFTTNFTYECQ